MRGGEGGRVSEAVDTLVIGAGQAGLAMSYALAEHGLEHVVLERGRIGERWQSERWDSLAFQFPNWSLRLPGLDYRGAQPDGFAGHLEVSARIVEYGATIHAPVRDGVEVVSLCASDVGFRADTNIGEIHARNVVLATGPFQRANLPSLAADIPANIAQLHSSRYRNPAQLPLGAVLVVGSGGSGAQIAEELVQSGRQVHLALSRHRRVPRRRYGRDVLSWLFDLGWMDRLATSLPDGRIPPTLLVTGVDGGRDLDLRRLHTQGVTLLGRLRGVDGISLLFNNDAPAILAAAEAGFDELVAAIDDYARAKGFDVAADGTDPLPPLRPDAPTTIETRAARIGSVVWCNGYAYDFDWVHVPCFNNGIPVQHRGVSQHEGLYFLGLHWMHTFKSGTFFGVGDDAAYLARKIAADRRSRR